ncbi:MAG TPA: multiubiquitin domain-containing protein [Candidatus Saccharimonadales bacterium]|nr:multiubiquitin domain-containing protein [Candidatus Saccharimonadales bacterium]
MTSTETVETPDARRHDYEIFVNTRPHRVDGDIVSYTHVVDIAFPGHPVNPNIYFEVTYKGAAGPKHDGTLLEGEAVQVKDGTRFHVTQTDRS